MPVRHSGQKFSNVSNDGQCVRYLKHWGKGISGHVPNDGQVDIKKTCSLNRPIFNIDLSQEQVQRGGRVIKGGPVLDEILEELEEEWHQYLKAN